MIVPNRFVFINCPFDISYQTLFDAICFTIICCGYKPRCGHEQVDSGQERLERLCVLMEQCQFGIHDISSVGHDPESKLPRFNMPFELGLFLGCARFGDDSQQSKKSLILDKERHRYQLFLSDISGRDVQEHNGDPRQAAMQTRTFLNAHGGRQLAGADYIWRLFEGFQKQLPDICAECKLDAGNLTFPDYVHTTNLFLKSLPGLNRRSAPSPT